MKILVADDDAVSRQMLQSVLTHAGYEVVPVADGTAATAILTQEGGPRIALLDWMMPGMDGPSICREVRNRQERPYVYIVLVTSKESKDDVIAGLEAGADDYLAKPFHPPELKARLRTGHRILRLEDQLVEAREEMRFKATHDALTMLWNHGVILELLQRELNRACREETSVAVLLADLDHFKRINDAYGHLVGDEVLQETARRLTETVRSYDVVGRYGGEEFLVLLPRCNAISTRDRAEQIRAAVCSQPMQTRQGPVSLTLSLGAVSSRDWGHVSADSLVKEADDALYRAKAQGRNRVVFVGPATAQGGGSERKSVEPVKLC